MRQFVRVAFLWVNNESACFLNYRKIFSKMSHSHNEATVLQLTNKSKKLLKMFSKHSIIFCIINKLINSLDSLEISLHQHRYQYNEILHTYIFTLTLKSKKLWNNKLRERKVKTLTRNWRDHERDTISPLIPVGVYGYSITWDRKSVV